MRLQTSHHAPQIASPTLPQGPSKRGWVGPHSPLARLPVCEEKGALAPLGVRGTSAGWRPQPDQDWMPRADGRTAAHGSQACLDVAVGSWGACDGRPCGNNSSGSTGQDPYTDASLQTGTERMVVPVLVLLSTPPPPEQLSVS